MESDIRWKQRLANYKRACANLAAAVKLARQRPLSELEVQGLIQSFEFTHELAWNVMKDWFDDQGTVGLTGSKDATREAFSKGLITDGQTWMDMVKSRNLSSHTDNSETAEDLRQSILSRYAPLLLGFRDAMSARENP
ncbi:MAG: nucleotidyltransferase substrate binding protein [Spirochaetales bacterium]